MKFYRQILRVLALICVVANAGADSIEIYVCKLYYNKYLLSILTIHGGDDVLTFETSGYVVMPSY